MQKKTNSIGILSKHLFSNNWHQSAIKSDKDMFIDLIECVNCSSKNMSLVLLKEMCILVL